MAGSTVRAFLVRGLVCGLLAGLAAGAFAFAVGEPGVERAIEIEEQASVGAPAGEPLVSRDGQRAGLFLATGLYGLGIGGLYVLAFAAVRGRTAARSDSSLALWLAGALFVAVVLVPFLKYPANPPAVGDPATIGERTQLYVTLIAISLLSLLAGWRIARRAGPLAGALVFVVTVAVVAALLPGVNEVPRSFPADLLWDFRVASLGVQLMLWS
ncbi:MAG: CbtA family protein, partial [Thermoleophilaceae bacterium]